MAADVDIVIPTFRRPDELARAVRSVFAQGRLAELCAGIVVVDNAPEAPARAVASALAAASPVPFAYVHEPRPGVATARNAGVAICRSRFVAFLDDDEQALPGWLDRLRAVHVSHSADVTFGPVRGVATGCRPWLAPYLDRFFSREGPDADGIIETIYGCGNSMMTRAGVLDGEAPFDPSSDFTGGEDDRLFQALRLRGARFAWAARAEVLEHAPAGRANLPYALKRAFCYGQSPSQAAARVRDVPKVLYWMGVGAGQASLYSLAAAALAILGRKLAAIRFLDLAVRGVGKVFWPFLIPLYGASVTPPARPGVRTATPSGSGAARRAPG